MLIGYARTSTTEQQAGLAGQERDLTAAGATRIYSEQVSSIAPSRPQLEAAIDFAREGDTLIVAKPDRLARSTADLLALVRRLEGKGVGILVLSMGGQQLDTRTATGKMMLTMLAAVAQFERDLMLERQKDGIAAAKAAGRYKGRAPTVRRQAPEMLRLLAEGVGKAEIARKLGVSRMSVHRLTREPAEQKAAQQPAGEAAG